MKTIKTVDCGDGVVEERVYENCQLVEVRRRVEGLVNVAPRKEMLRS